MSRYIKQFSIVIVFAAAIACFFAVKSIGFTLKTVINSKISIEEAVVVAEQHINGKASRTESAFSTQGWIYEVEVIRGAKAFDVMIDGSNGEIIPTAKIKRDVTHKFDLQRVITSLL